MIQKFGRSQKYIGFPLRLCGLAGEGFISRKGAKPQRRSNASLDDERFLG
jgi:hypothetical protein